MKVLFVAQFDSIHTIRCIALLKSYMPACVVAVFGSSPFTPIHLLDEYRALGVHLFTDTGAQYIGLHYWDLLYQHSSTPYSPKPSKLAECIEAYRPDIVHCFAAQEAGYLYSSSLVHTGYRPRRSILSTWGNDYIGFMHNDGHRAAILSMHSNFDIVHCENHRDIKLASELGYCGLFAPVVHISTTSETLMHECSTETSLPLVADKRPFLVVRGSYSVRGRSTTALAALQNIAMYLGDLTVIILSPAPVDIPEIHMLKNNINLRISQHLSRTKYISLLKRSLAYICVNMYDGLPQSFMESVYCGCFPFFGEGSGIASFNFGTSLPVVSPHDPNVLSSRIKNLLESPCQYSQSLLQVQQQLNTTMNSSSIQSILKLFYS